MLNAEHLALHRYNPVVHESDLPQGQGWSPLTWQILEWACSIPITLLEAVADLDSDPTHLEQQITLQVHKLVDKWRALQARANFKLSLAWFDRQQEVAEATRPQYGEASN